MPATIQVASHPANLWKAKNVTSSSDLLKGTSYEHHKAYKRIIQSSVSNDFLSKTHITSSDNGFVRAAFHAYNQHYHLIIRPDDVWFAILSQLNFYINAHAEELRNRFVSHEGQKELKIVFSSGSIDTLDFGVFARRMTALIQDNVKDPNVRDWIMPAFSTTTVCDRTTAAVLMMGSMQKYFSYLCSICCGIPSVTLLGEREDWEDILARLDKLPELGEEPSMFANLLRPVLRSFVATFDAKPSASTREFWAKIVHYERGGSGPSYLSGWLTAFCFWRNDGKSLYNERLLERFEVKEETCVLDGVSYHPVDTDDIPNGFASVPVKVDDDGDIYHTQMLAGAIGIQATSSKSPAAGAEGVSAEGEKLDSLQSLSGWLMYEIDENAKTETNLW